MQSNFKSELVVCVQYFSFAVLAGLVCFIMLTASGDADGELAVHINIGEAWKNYAPMMNWWLIVFAILSALRLLVVYTFSYHRGRRG